MPFAEFEKSLCDLLQVHESASTQITALVQLTAAWFCTHASKHHSGTSVGTAGPFPWPQSQGIQNSQIQLEERADSS